MATREELLQEQFRRVQEEAQQFLRDQVLGRVQLQREADIVEELIDRIGKMLSTSGQTTATETTQQIQRDFVRMFGRLGEVFAMQVANTLYGSARQLGAEGAGFGTLGRQLGRSFGGSLGSAIDRRFSPSSMAAEMRLFQRVGEFAGDIMLQTIAMQIEGFRMIGAKMAPVMTAGFTGEDSDYKQLGVEMTVLSNQIVLDTARSISEVANMGSKLSQLGLGFRESGAQATQYAFALSNVKNIQAETAYTLMEQAVRSHGQDWTIVTQAMERFTAATAMYQKQAAMGNDSVAQSLSSLENLLGMYNQVRSSIGVTSLDMLSLSNIFLAFVNVSKEMGGRTDMITQQVAGIMRSLFAIQQGSLGDIMMRSNFIVAQLNRTKMGRGILEEAKPVAAELGLDVEQHMPIVLEQMFASPGGAKTSERFTLAMSEALYEASTRGGPYGGVNNRVDAFNATFMATNTILKMPVRSFITMQQTGKQVAELSKEGWVAEDITQELTTEGMGGMSAGEIIAQSQVMAKSALSVQQEFNAQMSIATAVDLDLHGATVGTLIKVLPALRASVQVARQKRTARDIDRIRSQRDSMTSPGFLSGWFAESVNKLFGPKETTMVEPDTSKQVIVSSSARQVNGGVEQRVLTTAVP